MVITKQKLFFFLLPIALALVAVGYFFVRSLPRTRTRDFIATWVRDYRPSPVGEHDDGSRPIAVRLNGKTDTNVSTPTATTDAGGSGSPPTGSFSRESIAARIVEGALAQAKVGAKHTPGYFELKYPGGDLPPDKGVSTDVLIRAFRNAGLDLQQLVHEDMTKNFDKYPNIWGLRKPDPNIDHRRNPNLMCFFKRFARSLTCDTDEKSLAEWQPGDVVFWQLDDGRLHCGIVVDQKNQKGIPLVVHNLSVCTLEDCLTRWKIIGHFRYP